MLAAAAVWTQVCCKEKKSNCILTFVHFEVKRTLGGVLIGHLESEHKSNTEKETEKRVCDV